MSWARVSVSSGAKVVGEVPVVIPVLDIHDTGSCCQPATTSTKLCGGAEGSPARRCRNAAT